MIYDHIKNIGLYKGLTTALDAALDYIASVSADVENGTTLLDGGMKAVDGRPEPVKKVVMKVPVE